MATGRSSHTATLLPNGTVLVVGGLYQWQRNGGRPSQDIFDPATGLWTASNSFLDGLEDHTATLLANNTVLVAGGGLNPATMVTSATNLTGIYDPVAGAWVPSGNLKDTLMLHTATLLSSGKILVSGGVGGDDPSFHGTSRAETFDPATKSWTLTGSMGTLRFSHTAILLQDGKVLVAGGTGPGNTPIPPLSSAELYDPTTGVWTPTGSLTKARTGHTATLLPNGRVLVVGGADNTAEIFY